MSFKTLEQRYNEKVGDLYRGATSKFEDGRPSSGFNDDPLNVRRVGDESFGTISQLFGRFLPVARAFQDVLRITKFTASLRGVTFLLKQGLLQTGNTFESTRLINPLFTIANAVPFLHIRRHLTPGNLISAGLIKRTSTDLLNVRSMGQLQQDTYDKALGKPKSILGNITSAFTAKKNIGWNVRGDTVPEDFFEQNWTKSRPELGDGTDDSYFYNTQNDSFRKFKFGGGLIPSWRTDEYINIFTYKPGQGYNSERYIQFFGSDVANAKALQRTPDFSETPKRTELLNSETDSKTMMLYNEPSAAPYFIRYPTTTADVNGPVRKEGVAIWQSVRGIKNSGNGDISNKRRPLKEIADVSTLPYGSINNDFKDYINVTIAMGADSPIKFRAYLKDLQQTATPQYKEFQYVGRTEKFINFTGAQRDISFKLGLLATHPNELKEMWKRINYLTGLVFPYNISNGIYQPNIARITIGQVYVDQPMYITGLSTNFSEISESWDIYAEVPISAQIDLKCVLIEKNQKVAETPFYEIYQKYYSEEINDYNELNRRPLPQVPPASQARTAERVAAPPVTGPDPSQIRPAVIKPNPAPPQPKQPTRTSPPKRTPAPTGSGPQKPKPQGGVPSSKEILDGAANAQRTSVGLPPR